MNDRGFLVKGDRFSLTDPEKYILQGWIARETDVRAFLGEEQIPVTVDRLTENIDERHNGSEAQLSIRVPLPLPKGKKLSVYTFSEKGKKLCFSMPYSVLQKKGRTLQYFIEQFYASPQDGMIRVMGWAVSTEPVTIDLYDRNRKKIKCTPEWYSRVDVTETFSEAAVRPKCGFNIELRPIPQDVFYLVIRAGSEKAVLRYHTAPLAAKADKAMLRVEKARNYFRYNGFLAFVRKSTDKLIHPDEKPIIYSEWIRKHMPSDKALEKQRAEKFVPAPKISIAVPLYRTPAEYLTALVDSVKAQTYAEWELVLSDGSGPDSPLTKMLDGLASSDARIKVLHREEQLHIAENTNAAVDAASGDYIAFADHDDVLAPNALYEFAKAASADPKADLFYSDEDKIGVGDKFMQPNMKPDYDPDFLCSVNYICHMLMVKRTLLEKAGKLDPAYNGAQDYDFILRCTEKAEGIVHIPKILYHWRFFEGSTAENPESKRYAFEAGKRAVEAHYARLGLPASVEMGEYLGLYRTTWHWEEKPLISLLIPNKDHVTDLKRCIDSVLHKSTYPNFEIIIIENNSTEEATFAFYKELEAADKRIRTVFYKDAFNYSKINNFGEQYAKGDYLLLLNNDTEVITPEWMEEMLGYCLRPDVAAVGARLYYEDEMIQHAGVIVGWGGVAGHAFVNQKRGSTGYQHRVICAQDYSAETAACLMVRRAAFEEVGGFAEDLAIAFNDIDFCMKLRKAGYLIVYNPYAELYHYESKSRGLEDTPEKVARFQKEMAVFSRRWADILRDGDPYYNPNLSMVTQDFSLKRL